MELTDAALSSFPDTKMWERLKRKVISTLDPLQAMFVTPSSGSRNETEFREIAFVATIRREQSFSYFIF